ncbi:substrate-binding periplasmic protein [Thalassotalea sediminis]|uniref:substrate-binding periplasmic protein n=1 Tax=Thalassotalea sediminis TaxID=1759089 RepID=UPI00257373CE|nr:transporter substrate-binding domain-containing protein [Thalassotalea sediminis]
MTFLSAGKFVTSIWCISIFFISHLTFAKEVNDYFLDFYTENYPPSSYIHQDRLTGLSVETLKLMWQELKLPEKDIHVVPWARGFHYAKSNRHSVLFAMSRTPSRESLFHWVGPIFTATYVVVAKITIAQDKLTEERLFSNSFALIRDDITEELLKTKGVKNLIPSPDIEHAERMLANDRIDMMAISKSGLRSILARSPEKRDQYKIVYTLAEIGDYFAFNKAVPKSVVTQYQQAFNSVSPALEHLRTKFNVYESTSLAN